MINNKLVKNDKYKYYFLSLIYRNNKKHKLSKYLLQYSLNHDMKYKNYHNVALIGFYYLYKCSNKYKYISKYYTKKSIIINHDEDSMFNILNYYENNKKKYIYYLFFNVDNDDIKYYQIDKKMYLILILS